MNEARKPGDVTGGIWFRAAIRKESERCLKGEARTQWEEKKRTRVKRSQRSRSGKDRVKQIGPDEEPRSGMGEEKKAKRNPGEF